jgi:hypothetical protein
MLMLIIFNIAFFETAINFDLPDPRSYETD